MPEKAFNTTSKTVNDDTDKGRLGENVYNSSILEPEALPNITRLSSLKKKNQKHSPLAF